MNLVNYTFSFTLNDEFETYSITTDKGYGYALAQVTNKYPTATNIDCIEYEDVF